MSEKRAKEQRRVNNQPNIVIRIEVYKDGRVEVMGFPFNFNAAMEVMTAGMKRLTSYFVGMAKEGKLDDNLTIEQSRIVKPNMAVPFPNMRNRQN